MGNSEFNAGSNQHCTCMPYVIYLSLSVFQITILWWLVF